MTLAEAIRAIERYRPIDDTYWGDAIITLFNFAKEAEMKKAEGKHEPHMVYQSLIETVSRVRMYGVQKHGFEGGWKTTTVMQHLDAARRHLDEMIEATRRSDTSRLFDAESGQLHMAHAVCDLMFEIERISMNQGSLSKEDVK